MKPLSIARCFTGFACLLKRNTKTRKTKTRKKQRSWHLMNLQVRLNKVSRCSLFSWFPAFVFSCSYLAALLLQIAFELLHQVFHDETLLGARIHSSPFLPQILRHHGADRCYSDQRQALL